MDHRRRWAWRATGVPTWDDLQVLTAQMARKPLLDQDAVGTGIVIGPRAKKPLVLGIPLFASDMSFGALSAEAKTALAMGAEMAGTGICSGERAGCFLPSKRPIRAISTRWRVPSSAGRWTRWRSVRPSTSKVAKARRPAPAVICRVRRSMPRLPPCAGSPKEPQRLAPRHLPIW